MLARISIFVGLSVLAAAQCSSFSTCAACSGDFSCAWCQTPSSADSPTGVCQPYANSCGSGRGKYYSCPSASVCSNYTARGCSSCAGVAECEWWSPGASSSAGAVCSATISALAPSGWFYYPTVSSCSTDPSAVVASLGNAIIAAIVIAVLVIFVLPVSLFVAVCVCGCVICGMGRSRQAYVAVPQQQYQAFPQQQQQPGYPAYQPQVQQPQTQPQQPQYQQPQYTAGYPVAKAAT